MYIPLTKEFILERYLVSENAERHNIIEQYIPSSEIQQALRLVHNNCIVSILDLPELQNGLIYCVSGYRCQELNDLITKKKNSKSQHILGYALDIEYYENGIEDNLKLYKAILKSQMQFDQLISEFGTVEKPAWIHISYRPINNRNMTFRIPKI